MEPKGKRVLQKDQNAKEPGSQQEDLGGQWAGRVGTALQETRLEYQKTRGPLDEY